MRNENLQTNCLISIKTTIEDITNMFMKTSIYPKQLLENDIQHFSINTTI